jgi:elongation factor Ts
MSLRRFKRFGSGGKLTSYVHGGSGADRAIAGSIGVIVEYEGDEAAAKDVAMHVACNKPSGLSPKDVPESAVAAERRVAEQKAAESGKPPAIGE